MAAEIRAHYLTGKTLYAVVLRASDGQVWNGSSFESLLTANWSTYAVTMTEQSTTGFYYGTFPVVAVGLYDVWIYWRSGGSPATTDVLVGQQNEDWSGTIDLGVCKVVDSSNRVNVGTWLSQAVTL